MKRSFLFITFLIGSLFFFVPCYGQDEAKDVLSNMQYTIEAQGSFSHGNTPLWLNANKYGLSSLKESNGYLRASLERPLETDSFFRWGVGWCADLAVPFGYTSNFIVQQLYVEGRWLHGVLSIGSKEWPMELKNEELSSGAQVLGKNARPIPQIRLALPTWWDVPLTKGWLSLKGHITYGMMTDDSWQREMTGCKSKYSENVFYHGKALYFKIGNSHRNFPFSLELGVESGGTFGGTSYKSNSDGTMDTIRNDNSLRAFWNAFTIQGKDVVETVFTNKQGNTVGAWLIRLKYENTLWALKLYGEHFFEDGSGMRGWANDNDYYDEEGNIKHNNRKLFYGFKDLLIGLELNLFRQTWVQNVVFEYIYTKYQCGPINHDETTNMLDVVFGNDNFYNHYIYSGWQHWGQVIGNPLYRSPIYNTNGEIYVQNNRFMAFHLGLSATISSVHYRVLASWQDGLGTYDMPYTSNRHNLSLLSEVSVRMPDRLKGWSVKGAIGVDFGNIYNDFGNNYGFQLTITKSGLLR